MKMFLGGTFVLVVSFVGSAAISEELIAPGPWLPESGAPTQATVLPPGPPSAGVLAERCPLYGVPMPCGLAAGHMCVPRLREFGYFLTHWRIWPGEPPSIGVSPQETGVEPAAPPGAERLPLPAAEESAAPQAPPSQEDFRKPEVPGEPNLPVPLESMQPFPSQQNPPRSSNEPVLPERSYHRPSWRPGQPASTSWHAPIRQPKPFPSDRERPVSSDSIRTIPNVTRSDPRPTSDLATATVGHFGGDPTFAAFIDRAGQLPALQPSPQLPSPCQSPQCEAKIWVEDQAGRAEAAQVQFRESQAPAWQTCQLGGYCPVELVENGKWTPGNVRWAVLHRGRLYYTSGPDQQQRFLADPGRYAPAFGGLDPVVFLDENREVPGKAEYCLIYDGRLYAFSSCSSLTKFRHYPRLYALLAAEPDGRRDR